jgi:hypothetical protein
VGGHPSPAREVTVDFLYESCHVVGETAHGLIPHFDCESYVYGVLDSYVALRASLPKAERACFPAALPPWQALQLGSKHIDARVRTNPAGPFLIETLRRKYPCKE